MISLNGKWSFRSCLLVLFSVHFALISRGFCESSIESANSHPDARTSEPNYDWGLFGGIGTGYGLVSGQSFSDSPEGAQALLNAVLSYQMKKWVFDGGIGWIYSNVSGRTQPSQSVQIITRAGLLELSPRFKLTEKWQLGPVLNLAFGTDTSFSSSVAPSMSSYFAGLKGVYETHYSHFPLRFWAQLSTDLSANSQSVYLGLVGIQIGFPIHQPQKNTSVTTQARHENTENVHDVQVTLDPQKVFFGTSSASLRSDVDHVLKDVGNYLKENERPSSVQISGHADQRGRFQYNLMLSRKRAEAVRDALLSGGAPSTHLSVQANSYLHPLDPSNTKQAWAKNRRVEITFRSVKNPELLREKLKPLAAEQSKESHTN